MSIKRFIFRYYIIVFLAILVLVIVWLYFSSQARDDVALALTILGGVFSLFYFVQQQQLEELKLFKELFNEFNTRYEKLNDKLENITERTEEDILTNED